MGATILIIEDNPANMELMAYLLRAFGHTVYTAYDGAAGIHMAYYGRPELIACDVHMPRMDGYEIVRRLKEDEALRRIPVVAVTALAMVGDKEKLLAAGFDGYIGKPIDPEQFVGEIEKYLPAGLRPKSASSLQASRPGSA
ncbi:MAG: response regulator [Burkholderiales bacterium]|nr:response regulator [Burkholderiales bacterium]